MVRNNPGKMHVVPDPEGIGSGSQFGPERSVTHEQQIQRRLP